MAIPVFVSIARNATVQLQDKEVRGHFMGSEIQLAVEIKNDRALLTEPFNGVLVSMAAKGLNAVNVIVDADQVHVLGNYDPDHITFRCCVSICGTTACCESACLTCNGTTVCC